MYQTARQVNTWEGDVKGIALSVYYTVTPAERGDRDSYGAPMTPDFDAEIELSEVEHNGEDILDIIDNDTIKRIENAIRGRK